MYEINYHYSNSDKFYRHSVTPITVIRHDIKPDCSSPSITAFDKTGRLFEGSI